nr:MAG TPA: hypothetical protein [Caudoviricetes sp.]
MTTGFFLNFFFSIQITTFHFFRKGDTLCLA